MTDDTSLAVHCVLASRRGQHPVNEDAVAFAGWVLHADRGDLLEVTLSSDGTGPLRLAVADGMGGRPAGATAARVAVEVLTGLPSTVGAADPAWLRTLFESADDAVRAAATDSTAGLGCAAAYLEIGADGASVVANVGDVRVYQSLDGYLAVLTRDDRRPVRDPRAPGYVTRCLGGSRRDDVTPHRFALQLHPGDALFMITDGGYDLLEDARLEASLDRSLRTTVEQMVAAALDAGTADDVTVLAVELLRSPPAG
ncbi:PP2C family protein-serine/threonine phosphatase [Jatrophihabitans sp.]|jgi:serine/threonine-protein phosphatase Stp1|uniref:PP2C family protein-serine/threonine phosphatase n=1 Tax=Jatrophihabitans sp. TaxID=1932789 RepID=UPI002EEB97ED